MASQHFYCPHCKRKLTKSAQAYVLSEVFEGGEHNFIGLGELPPYVTCPGCGGRISSMKMVKGDYDKYRKREPLFSVIAWVFYTGGSLLAAILLKKNFHWDWWLAILVGLFAGFFTGDVVAKMVEVLVRKKTKPLA